MSETTEFMNPPEKTKQYELRELCGKDVFPMFKIISKIGVKEFKDCFESDELKSMSDGVDDNDGRMQAIGLKVVMNVAGVVISNAPDAEEDIYTFLSELSGIKKKEIGELPFATFASMIIDVFQKDEFKDFIQVVSKLFK